MFRSATFKLTLWYVCLVVVISLAFSVFLYRVGTNDLAHGLHHESDRISRQFPVFQNDPVLRPAVDITNADHVLLIRLINFNVVVLIISGFASYWLARRTLNPIEEAHAQQTRFTADVSHELRTPLTALKMESEVALMNPKAKSSELRQTIVSNLEEVGKLEALINNLLRLTRLDADELRQKFTKVASEVIIADALKQVASVAAERKISINDKTAKFSVDADKDSLIQLLVILLDNALKYSSEGSTITLSSRKTDHTVELAVADQGVGIDRAALEHVFDRFYRADNSRNKTNTEGYGLGLSIAKMIADVHGGEIKLSSRPGHGTTAFIVLPTK